MGMAAAAAAAEEATGGMSEEDRVSAALDALSAMDDERGGDRDEQDRAIANLVSAMELGPEGTDLGDAATTSAGAAAISPTTPRTGITGAIGDVLDTNKDGKISAGEAALGIAAATTPLGAMMGIGKGIENVATALGFGTNIGSEQTGMLAEQNRGLYGFDDDEGDRGGDGDDRPDVEPEVPEELTIEELSKPPTIDIIPFRPEDFYYFQQPFSYTRQGLPSMMNMRTR